VTAASYEVIPSAKRLIRSLRNMGYDFAAAVADLIDNSIEARATIVWVDVDWNKGGESAYLSIVDNGLGMSPQNLREALRFGSERDYEDEDLGRFGLGLKTASLSQCLKFTVASRLNPSRSDIVAYCWDVEHVDATNRWEILRVPVITLHEHIRQHLRQTTGTALIWERLDRILGYKRPDGEVARKQLHAMGRELEEHLAMVFHRFLSGEIRGRRLAIYVNGRKIQPWDPFARAEPNTKKLHAASFRVEGLHGRADIVVEPFVLPAQSQFSTSEAWNRASGPQKWNKQQGFYIYRAGRMIQSGGWNGIRALDEHRKLSRVAISFSPKLDEEFKINVPKMRVSLPSSVREEIAQFVAPAVQMAEDEYRQRHSIVPALVVADVSREESSGSALRALSSSPEGDDTPFLLSAGSVTPISREDVHRVGHHLLRIAKPEERPTLNSVIERALSVCLRGTTLADMSAPQERRQNWRERRVRRYASII
jgi:Histidine kinase-, DNA gyrase B-, and HSP90-like ATPase